MMTPDAHIPGPARVSILERIVPSFAFAVAALGGAVGGAMLVNFFRIVRQSENAGAAVFFGSIAEIEVVVGVVLAFAAVLCAIAIIVSIVRMFTTNKTSSPPGVLFLLLGALSLVPPYLLSYVLRLMKEVVTSPTQTEGGVSAVADMIITVSYVAIGSTGMIAIILLAFAFIPFSSMSGRKVLPLVCLILVEILIVVLMGVYFWGARTSFAERDRDHGNYPPPASEPDTTDTTDYNTDSNSIANEADNSFRGAAETNSNGPVKVISGGVLNGKAINLPQPPYPPAARVARAEGSVSVQIMIDEKGAVISANAVSGHPLLRAAAVQAARGARFAPTKLSGQPVKVSGVLTFRFSPE